MTITELQNQIQQKALELPPDLLQEVYDYMEFIVVKSKKREDAQDQSLAEGAYRGICSGGYRPGPLADEEYLVKQFLSWYCDQLTETPAH